MHNADILVFFVVKWLVLFIYLFFTMLAVEKESNEVSLSLDCILFYLPGKLFHNPGRKTGHFSQDL